MTGDAAQTDTGWLAQLHALDVNIYRAIAASETPAIDRALGQLSNAADKSKIWVGIAAGLAIQGSRGREAAFDGIASILVASTIVNLVFKPMGRRERPDRVGGMVPVSRHVHMPTSTSFPSGHSASAFAFAGGVAAVMPAAAVPVRATAALVAYSRVHTGVHYPGDVVIGSLIGGALAPLTTKTLGRLRQRLAN